MAKQKRTGAVADFDHLQKEIKKDARAGSVTELFRSFGKANLAYLGQLERKPLTTPIPNKHYFSFVNAKTKSRAVNQDLFQGGALVDKFLNAVHSRQIVASLASEEITRACYTLAVSLACVVDLENPGCHPSGYTDPVVVG